MGVETLEVRGNDSPDFHDVVVSSIFGALKAAYLAGKGDRKTG
jgi:hypothetical protein